MDNPSRGPDSLTSVELIRRAKVGDRSAADQLYRRYLPILTRWTTGRLPPAARGALETADLVQDIVIRTMRNLESFTYEREGALLAYMRTALMNRVREEVRRLGRRGESVDVDDAVLESPAPSPLAHVVGVNQLERYEHALGALTESDRELIILRVEMGLSYPEVAEATGKQTTSAARMGVSRALARLARHMVDTGTRDGEA